MRKTAICLAVICALALAGVAVKAADPANVAGAWEMTSAGRQGPQTSTITFEQDGGKIKGKIVRQGQNGPTETPFEGTVDGNKISFTVKRQTQNGEITITYSGTVDGDGIKGTMAMGQGEPREWSAKRSK
jgi:uncharacterized protein (TIGR03066 family)